MHLILILLLLCTAAFAEETKQDSVKYQLPEQTVTGSRVTENWMDNATSISALSKADQPVTRGLGIADKLLLIPGLAANSRFGTDDMRLSMRGMGLRSNTGERSVRVLYDGIPESEPDGQTRLEGVEIGNIDQIEMLRGSGSALYGNAAGGVLNVKTIEGFNHDGASLELEGGGDGFFRGKVTLANGKNSRNDHGLLSISEIKSDGWREHSKYEAQLVSGSYKIASSTNSSLKALLYFVNAKIELPGEITVAQFEDDPLQADSLYVARDVKRFTRKGRLGLSYSRVLASNLSLNFTPYVALKKLDRARENAEFQRITRYVLGSSAQADWNTKINKRNLRVVFGLDEQLMDGPVNFYNNVHGEPDTVVLANEQERQWQIGGFAQGDLELNDKWSATLGLRMEKLEIEAFPLSTAGEEEGEEKELEPAIIPRAGVRYKLNNEMSIYGTVYGGYETPTLSEKENSNASFPKDLEPQTSFTAELGLRGDREWRGADMQYEATLYRMMVSDYIMPDINRGDKLFVNADQTIHQGIELSAKMVKPRLGYVGIAVSIGDFYFDEFMQDSLDFKDNKIPGVSPNLFGAMVRWTPRDYFWAELNAKMSGAAYANTENTVKADGWMTLGAAIGGDIPTNAFTASWHLGVSNLTDEKYVSFIQVNGFKAPGHSDDRYYQSGMPMTVFAGISIGTKGL